MARTVGSVRKEEDSKNDHNDNNKKRKVDPPEGGENNNKANKTMKKKQANEEEGSTPPKAPKLAPDKFTIHLLELGTGNNEEEIPPLIVQERILEEFPLLLPHMKRGDAVENLNGGGYRSSGTVFVDAVDAEAGTLELIDRGDDIDEYGTQPTHYTTLDMFPPDYFNPDKAQINNMYCPNTKESNLYWHTDGGWSIFSKEMASKIVKDEDNPNNGTLEHEGKTYRFLGLSDGQTDSGLLVASDYNEETRTFGAGYC